MVVRYNSIRINRSFIFIILAVLSIDMQVRASCDCHDVLDPTRIDRYTFIPSQSSVIQTGGIAGVNEKYPIGGQFQLYTDSNEAIASFRRVEATLTGTSGFLYTRDLNELFNMTGLAGTIVSEASISFKGDTTDGSKSQVSIKLTLTDGSVHLTGQITPPSKSADMFTYKLDAVAEKKYGGGIGEPNFPYLIYTAEQLNNIGPDFLNRDKQYKLMADIDLGDYKDTSFNIIGINEFDAFVGIFDGNGKTISNLTFTPTNTNNIGLLGYIGYNAEIKNLGLIDPNIDAGTGSYVGALAGQNSGTIINCYAVGGNVSGGNSVGGLVGSNTVSADEELEIISAGAIRSSFSGVHVSGAESTGGLAGANSGIISNCYSTSNVSATLDVGGLVGANIYGAGPGTISNCYSVGTVDGTIQVGGLVGNNNGTVEASFWDVQTSGLSISAGGTGKTTAEMQTQSTYVDAGWDFLGESDSGIEDIWWIVEGQDYPQLAWEISEVE